MRILAAILQLSRDALYSIYEVPTLHTKKNIVKPVGFALQLFDFVKKEKEENCSVLNYLRKDKSLRF